MSEKKGIQTLKEQGPQPVICPINLEVALWLEQTTTTTTRQTTIHRILRILRTAQTTVLKITRRTARTAQTTIITTNKSVLGQEKARLAIRLCLFLFDRWC